LSKILPLESADMHYCLEKRDVVTDYEIGITPFIKAKRFEGKCNIVNVQPAWSLAALLSVLDFPSLTQNKEDEWEVCVFDHDNDDYIEKTASNPVDTCYKMILKLKEINLL
jgi:hypothetical protein